MLELEEINEINGVFFIYSFTEMGEGLVEWCIWILTPNSEATD